MQNLRDKLALITGAASGIGRAVAMELASLGTKLLLVDRDSVGLNALAEILQQQGTTVETKLLDLADLAAVAEFASQLDKEHSLDLLINNAGVVHFGPTVEMGVAEMERLMAVNLLAPMLLTRALLPQLLQRPEAHLVNVASIYGIVATSRCAAYHASKFGLLGFSESMFVELRGTKVGVSTVCPGFVHTNLFESGTSSSGINNKVRGVPHPPAYLCTTPQIVAQRIVRGIQRRKRLVIVTPLAWSLYYTQRFAPWLLPLARLGVATP